MSLFDSLVAEALHNQRELAPMQAVVEKELLHHDILREMSAAGMLHNLTFINNLMKKIRSSINEGTFDSYKKEFLSDYQITNEQVRISQKEKWLRSREE